MKKTLSIIAFAATLVIVLTVIAFASNANTNNEENKSDTSITEVTEKEDCCQGCCGDQNKINTKLNSER